MFHDYPKIQDPAVQQKMIDYINLKLSFLGYPSQKMNKASDMLKIANPLARIYQERNRLLENYPPPADQRIQDFLNAYLHDLKLRAPIKLPANSFILDYPGLARIMSLAPEKNIFVSDIITSYRIKQGVLHNPKSDRRTTQGVFHIAENGLPIPDDKISVPKQAFAHMLAEAMRPPRELMRLPFTDAQDNKAELFISLLLRPVVSPAVEGYLPEKSMEIRFFAPGNLISNLDFVESIFGNAGNPYLPENDAALDIEHWTGHTGCVILAPHLINVKKKDAGLPHFDQATERQRRDGMCWKSADELYNNGQAFKITCRDHRGVIVTLIADNYFGYCKKEVKTQMSYAANLYGLCEEEHSGGAIAFASYDLGEDFSFDQLMIKNTSTFQDVLDCYGSRIEVKPEGYGVDKLYSDIVYLPENAKFDLPEQIITWKSNGAEQKLKLLAHHTYLLPSGYKIHIKKQTGGYAWHLIGTSAEGVHCHKPCTVSGGGKSEISKSIVDAMIQGPVYTADLHNDLDQVVELLKKDYGHRFKSEFARTEPSRPILSSQRSLGSVIKLFTPSSEYTEEYNTWLQSIPPHIFDILLAVKRFYQPEWGENWREYFSVDIINGHLGHELKFKNKKLIANYLRVGREKDGAWRIYRVRQDFAAAEKLQMADDITASIVVPKEKLKHLNPEYPQPSVKLLTNCEHRLFQRPDDAIYRGYDKQAEADLASEGSFLSNYEPLSAEKVREIIQDIVNFDMYTDPMKKLIQDFMQDERNSFVASSAHPRIVDGKPSKNPRYLQNRPDKANPKKGYLAEVGVRLARKIPLQEPVYFPVNAVLPGRRNNPPDTKAGIPALAVYNPIHYQELPELFLDFICSLTGKSPSTTGFGSEGALTKGPFNALWPVVDLNNALVSYIITGYNGFSSAAGYIGPKYRVDHDISLLMPEIWCRMKPEEQDPPFLIQNGYLAKVRDFEFQGKPVKASILGYRITSKFVKAFLGRIFNTPSIVFNEEMLCPEKQSLEVFVDGIENMVVTQKRVAEYYFKDGSVEAACPPLKALLHIMALGHFEGKNLEDASVRALFTRQNMVASDWYHKRLLTKQERDILLWQHNVEYLSQFISKSGNVAAIRQLELRNRLSNAKEELKKAQSPDYVESLVGTIGADPLDKQIFPAVQDKSTPKSLSASAAESSPLRK